MGDPLAILFECPRFGPLTHRACLRRQVERLEALDKGGRHIPGPPARAYCAGGTCEVGRGIRQEHRELELSACPTCGTALLGDAYCPTCAARAAEKKPPRGALPTHVEPSSRIWTENLPEAPFVPPATRLPNRTPSRGQQVAGADGSTERQHPEAAGINRPVPLLPAGRRGSAEGGPPTPAAAANPTSPASPAEEDKMLCDRGCGREVRQKPGKETRTTCRKCRVKVAARKNGVAPVKEPRPRPTRVRGPEGGGVEEFDPRELSEEQLAACVVEARERGGRIRREADERLAKLDAALKTVVATGG